MNTGETMQWLTDKDEHGEYRIPKIIYSDAYSSEMVAYADLVLPDTTYLERFDAVSMLDRPISDADGAADAIRHPVLAPDADAGRDVPASKCPARPGRTPGATAMGAGWVTAYRDYATTSSPRARARVGLLAGWRGADGSAGAARPSPTARHTSPRRVWRQEIRNQRAISRWPIATI